MHVHQTQTFKKWFTDLKDHRARAKIRFAIEEICHQEVLLGDIKYLGGGLYELRIWSGPGYRIYFTQKNSKILFLLAGGVKDSQNRDIARARKTLVQVEKD